MPIQTICLTCEEDIEVSDRDIKVASQHRGNSNGKVLISCPECCRVMALPEPVPTGEADLEEWIIEKYAEGEDWLECVRILEPELEIEPAGVNDYQGKKLYRPGSGGEPIMKRPYMAKYGVNPECMVAKMRGHGRGVHTEIRDGPFGVTTHPQPHAGVVTQNPKPGSRPGVHVGYQEPEKK